jgi:hypothetical protein
MHGEYEPILGILSPAVDNVKMLKMLTIVRDIYVI